MVNAFLWLYQMCVTKGRASSWAIHDEVNQGTGILWVICVMSVIKVRTSLWDMCDKCNKWMGVIMIHV